MERNEERIRKKKIDLIVKVEKEKWNLLKKHQEEKKKRKNDKSKYDKYIFQQPNQIRIVVLGESCSGKTSLIYRFIYDRFDPEYKTTTRIEALKSELLFFDGQPFRVELIDTPPLENFYKNLEDILYFVQGVIFVFDASNKNSFLRMQDYFKMTNFYEFQKIGIVATKKDICTEKNKYKFYQLKKFCELHNATPYFLSLKNSKEEVADFINLLCPEIIPSLVEKKEVLNLQYPYTKSIKNNIPKRNYIDEEIIKKAKEEDSSYDSEESKNIVKKDKEEEIKEFYLRKKNAVVKKEERAKINYIYNIGNKNKQYKEDSHFKEDKNINNLEEKKEELESFNDVIGNINIDLEKLFNKYRPESGSIKNGKKYKKDRYKNKNKNKTLEDGGEWVNVNIDNLVDEFLKTKSELKKNKKEKKLDDKKLDDKKSSKKSNKVSNSEKENKKPKKESIDEDEKEDNKENKEDEKEKENDEDKKDNNKESKKESEEENEENEENDGKNEQDMNDEYYENLYGDIYDFQQSLKNEVMKEQENNTDND